MLIYSDPARGNELARTYRGPRRSRYTMTVSGWYAGGISARNDSEALAVFKSILAREGAAVV